MRRTTAGQAVNDPRTALGRAAAQTSKERAARIKRAQEIIAREGGTLENALARIWGVS